MSFATLIGAMISSAADASALAIPDQPISMPAGCHALSYRTEPLTSDGTKSQFPQAKEHVRADIVCIGDTIVIDKPIFSNGGDIIIWANNLVVKASLDSRAYVNHSELDYFQPRTPRPEGGYFLSAKEALTSPWGAGEDHRYFDSFAQYYQGCVDCLTIGGAHWIPRAPSGLVPAYSAGAGHGPDRIKDGLAPFDDGINFQALASGNIHVMAAKLEIDPSMAQPVDGSTEPPCDDVSAVAPFVFEARGIEGGRGGAGTPSPCTTYENHGPFSCGGDSYVISGRSGPGGRGGDAGNIYLIKINDHWSSEERARLSSLSNTRGGRPGSNISYWSPTARGDFAATGNACDFARKPGPNHSESATGKPGELIVQSMGSSASLKFLGQLLQSKDARLDYDFAELAQRALTSPGLAQLSFDDYLNANLATYLAGAEISAIDSLRSLVVYNKVEKAPLLPAQLAGLNGGALEGASLSDRSRVFTRQIIEFSDTSVDYPLAGYLGKSGGLLDIFDDRPLDRFYSEAIRVDLSDQTEQLTAIQAQLNDIGATLAEIDIRQERQERLAEIQNLSLAIAAARAEAEKSSDLAWAGELVSRLGVAAEASAAMYEAYSTSNAAALLKTSGSFLSSLDNVRAMWANHAGDSGQLPELVQRMSQLQQEYAQFISRSATVRLHYQDERMKVLSKILKSRGSLASRLEVRHAQFHDLLRLSYVSYISDPAKNLSSFENNLDSLKVFLTVFPNAEPYFQFRTLDLKCVEYSHLFGGRKPDRRCIRVGPSIDPRVVVEATGDSAGAIPLYVIAPRSQFIDLPTFGLDARISPNPQRAHESRLADNPDALFP